MRAGLALVPFATLGLLCPVPSFVIALRRRRASDWVAFAAFCAVWACWVAQNAMTAEDTYGVEFAADVLLLALSTAGAAVHAWVAGPTGRGSAGGQR
ncbi:hypothetical protein [Streptomyces melanogenes]|uniref:hypothetical protein n=1 Tax=Streptomyces melanogenes TaxID=67326 RepID=UPI00167CCC0A|nr:hypothetical protein [Streptomyces melanogenes]GGP84676.1 hypothetical protein GCM10010278_73980 [Streptomyces melanogenes]